MAALTEAADSAMDHTHDHDDHDGHAHTRGHAHGRVAPANVRARRLLIAFALTALTLFAEAVGGWWSGSLALLADAGHMLVDAAALLLAWAGAHFAEKSPDDRRSFGYARLEVLVGYTNSLAQFGLVAWIVYEAAGRLFAPTGILSGVMLAIALFGLAVNAGVLGLLHDHDHHDLNAASARLHVLGDLLGSVGAVVAALLIRAFGWNWADPAISVAVSLLILGNAWRLLHRSGHILLEGTPNGIDVGELVSAIHGAGIGATDVHHVHVWELRGGNPMATLHARIEPGADPDGVIAAIQRVLGERFGIRHATVQVESATCGPACGHCG